MPRYVTVKDNGAQALVERLLRKPRRLKVGVIGDAASEEKTSLGGDEEGALTVAQVALKIEYGIDQPRRSWLRDYVSANQRAILKSLEQIAIRTIKSRGRITIDQGLDALGDRIEAEIKGRIEGGIDPPNAPATIDQKESATPLKATGQFLNSISHKLDDVRVG